jgi:hypothetical protein
MSRIRADLKNQRYGRLTAIEFLHADKGGNAIWQCVCDCGKKVACGSSHLKSGHTKSCGCRKSEILKTVGIIHGYSSKVGERHRLYRIWRGMLNRCLNAKVKAYQWYGAKNIKVCDAWKKFIAFKDWALSHGYDDNLTIDRIDSNEDYAPENCQWLTIVENVKKEHSRRGFKTAQNLA